LRVDATYPNGSIDIYPARESGITVTFQHQNANLDLGQSVPWRDGRLCVDLPGVHLGGERLLNQPRTSSTRMLWHCERAQEWLRCAATDSLVKNGEVFEPPQYKTINSDVRIFYNEDKSTLARWRPLYGKCGRAELIALRADACFVGQIEDVLGGSFAPRWGTAIIGSEKRRPAFWIACGDLLMVGPHGAPYTWDDLRASAGRVGVDLDIHLRRITQRARGLNQESVLLIGQPIPETVGAPPSEMMWQALMMPELSRGHRPGFRDLEKSHWIIDRSQAFGGGKLIQWLQTDNVSESHMSVRGELSEPLRKGCVVILGCGSLGSALADQLVRMGARSLTLIDPEQFEIENIRRHVLTMNQVGRSKAHALAKYLNSSGVFAEVIGLQARYPSAAVASELAKADLVIDCTAEDIVLSRALTEGDRWCFSFSLGANAEKLFAYGARERWYDQTEYRKELEPFLAETRAALSENPNLRYVGCSNPVFPSPWNRIVKHAGTAIEFMNRAVLTDGARQITTFSAKPTS